LLRADNLVPDKQGALSLRSGSAEVYTDLGTTVHSLHTAELNNGTTYRAAGVDDTIYINGINKQSGVDGSGDIAMGDDTYQMFFARGTTRKKWDGTNWYNWSIEQPTEAPTLEAVAAITTSAAAFNDSESPATTIQEGAGAAGNATDHAGNANEATTLTPDGSTYQGIIRRLFTSDQDFFDVSGVDGSETDLLDFFVKIEKPRNVESIKIVFGADDSSTIPFKTNRFEFEFDIANGVERRRSA